MKQADAVYEAMKQLGGFATFGQLNQVALKVEGCQWKTKTPFATIRRIVQQDERFFRIKPGLWALNEERAKLQTLGVLEVAGNTEKAKVFEHSYYQGLLVEIGNLLSMSTFVPYQDKNKPFTGTQKLCDVATIEKFYDFTYERLVRRAITIDVTWFNERQLPNAFFEVEHSTDIQNSLLKFLDLQDFRAQFYIVANEARKAEWKNKMSLAAFKPLEGLVDFINYDSLAQRYEKETQLAAVRAATNF